MAHAEITRVLPGEHVVTRWSGGETAQIAIAPEGAVYADRDFLWRLSSATVELEESDFTPLPDYDRFLSTLRGTIRVSHDGGDAVELSPYGVHAFDGGAATKSWGTCRDFNLMLRKGRCRGTLTSLQLGEGTVAVLPRTLSEERGERTVAVYCAQGGGVLLTEGEAAPAAQGEALLIRRPEGTLRFESRGMTGLMIAEIVVV